MKTRRASLGRDLTGGPESVVVSFRLARGESDTHNTLLYYSEWEGVPELSEHVS